MIRLNLVFLRNLELPLNRPFNIRNYKFERIAFCKQCGGLIGLLEGGRYYLYRHAELVEEFKSYCEAYPTVIYAQPKDGFTSNSLTFIRRSTREVSI